MNNTDDTNITFRIIFIPSHIHSADECEELLGLVPELGIFGRGKTRNEVQQEIRNKILAHMNKRGSRL